MAKNILYSLLSFYLVFLTGTTVVEANVPPFIPGYKPIPAPFPTETEEEPGSQYPSIDSSGVIEIKLSGRDYTNNLDLLETIRNDEYYKKIPQDILRGTPRMDMRYVISLDGQLDEDTYVKYDIEKEPDFPGKYNIVLEKDDDRLSFGDQNVEFNKGSFTKVNRSVSGVHAERKTKTWDAQLLMAKTKSDPQKFEQFGDGSSSYKLGKAYIKEGSVVVYVNNRRLSEYSDYTVNYYNGIINFTSIKSSTDYIKVIYESTNPIQDFLPTLSNKNITAVDVSWRPEHAPVTETFIKSKKKETLFSAGDEEAELIPSRKVPLEKHPIVLGSETVFVGDTPLLSQSDYVVSYHTGDISIKELMLMPGQSLNIEYDYYETAAVTENITAAGTPGPYHLKNRHLIGDSVRVHIDSVLAREFIDYRFNPDSGQITFQYPIHEQQDVKVAYTYKKTKIEEQRVHESPISVGVSYIRETSKENEELTITVEGESPSVVATDQLSVYTDYNPIDDSQVFTLYEDGEEVPDTSYTIDPYTGLIEFDEAIDGDITVDYTYIKSVSTEVTFQASGLSSYESNVNFEMPNTPVKHGSVWKVVLYRDGEEVYLENSDERQDYSIDYLDDGEGIVISFLSDDGSYFESYPPIPQSGDIITVYYYYSPSVSLSQGDSDQQLLDIFANVQMNPDWNLYTEYAHSYYKFSKSRSSATDTITIDSSSDNNKYFLDKSPVVKDTEVVRINGITQTADQDYYINYEKGSIRFVDNSLPEGTEVEVKYQYFSSDTPESNNSNAIRLKSVYSPNEQLSVENEFLSIDPLFLSMGELEEDPGVMSLKNNMTWKPRAEDELDLQYILKQKSNKKGAIIKEESDLSTGYTFVVAGAQIENQFRYLERQTTQNADEDSLKITSYTPRLSFGSPQSRTSVYGELSQREDNFDDPSASSNTMISSYGISHDLSQNKFLFLDQFKFSPFFETIEESERSANELNAKQISRLGGSTSSKISKDFSLNSELEKKEIKYSTNTSSITDDFYNYNGSINYHPTSWFYSTLSITHKETVGSVPGQEDKVEDYSRFSIQELQPYFLFRGKLPRFLYRPLLGSKFTASLGQTTRREDNASKSYLQDSYSAQLSRFSPIRQLEFSQISGEWRESQFTDTSKYSYQIHSDSDNLYRKLNMKASTKSLSFFNKAFDYGVDLAISDSDSNTIKDISRSTENTSVSNLVNIDASHSINYALGDIRLPLLSFKDSQLIYTGSLSKQTNKKRNKSLYLSELAESSISQDNRSVTENKVSISTAIWNKIKLNTSIQSKVGYYNRNISTVGSLYQDKLIGSLSLSAPSFSFLNHTVSYEGSRVNQFDNDDLNIKKHELRNNFDERLYVKSHRYESKNTLKLNTLLSLTGNGSHQEIDQQIQVRATEGQAFSAQTASAGLILNPWKDLTLSYEYQIKHLKDSSRTYLGNQDYWKIMYQPVTYKNFSVNISLNGSKNWGYGFNDIDRSLLLQSSDEMLNYSIVDRDDYTVLGSINLNIAIPLDTIQYLDKLRLTGESYLKYINDKKNSENQYYVSGFIFTLGLDL